MPSRRDVLTGLAGSLAAAALSDPANADSKLKGPVDVERRRQLLGRPMAYYACPVPPPAQRDLTVEGAYVDKAFSIVDPEKLKRMREVTAGIGQFSWKVAQISDAWVRSRPAQPETARCGLLWLDTWARDDALLGKLDTPDSQHQRKWTLAGAALAFLKIADAPGLDPAAIARVRAWFVRLADAAAAYYATWPREGYNNHLYWLGLALAATAVALNDRTRLDHAFTFYDDAMQDMQPDGALPLEMGRKSKAFNYHLFSLIPLVMMAEIGAVNGRDLYGAKNGALHILAARVQTGLTDLSWFEQQSGSLQDWSGERVTPYTVSWGEPYYVRFPNAELGRFITAKRPIFYHWLGGSLTDSYGSAALPFPS